MAPFKNKIPEGFNGPIALPQDTKQADYWQDENRSWWERHPMLYDWKEKIAYKEFTKEFYLEIDKRFFPVLRTYMPWKKISFDSLIDFDSLKDMDVLEIGVGNGSLASLLARYARSFTGIDITDYALKCATNRMRCFCLDAKVIQMDAECMEFDDNTFDFILSWGVIHHTANPERLLQEMHRVLRPEGRALIMVYHRNFWNYYIMGALFRGLLQGELFRTGSLHKTIQRWVDGAIARFYSVPEWRVLAGEFFGIEKILIFGSKTEIILLPAGRIKQFISRFIPNALSRFLTNRCKMGSFLVSILKK